MKQKGWFLHPIEHGLSAKGIKTKIPIHAVYPFSRKKIASLENIETEEEAKNYKEQLERKPGIKTRVIKPDNNQYVIAYWHKETPKAAKAARMYEQYEKDMEVWTPKLASGLTPTQHQFLGRMFGYSKPRRRWFREEMEREIKST